MTSFVPVAHSRTSMMPAWLALGIARSLECRLALVAERAGHAIVQDFKALVVEPLAETMRVAGKRKPVLASSLGNAP
jgi:hypothetical protein